jgi:hypothetical protein
VNGGSEGVFTLTKDSSLGDLLARSPILESVEVMAIGHALDNINNTAGSGIIRPPDRAARAAGEDISLQPRLVRNEREHPTSGRVLGLVARDLARDRVVNIAASRGVRRDFRCATDNGSDFSLGGVRSDESRSAAPRRPSRELKCGWITTPPTPTSTVRRGSTCPVAATRAASAGLAITPS